MAAVAETEQERDPVDVVKPMGMTRAAFGILLGNSRTSLLTTDGTLCAALSLSDVALEVMEGWRTAGGRRE